MEFIFDTFDEAMNVHKELYKKVREQGYVTVAELYCIALDMNFETIAYNLHQYGWTNLWDFKVVPYEDDFKWMLKTPKQKYLKLKKEND